ncbi:hypothetical protein C8J57DRAFT_1477592 [Mycena rebaudengoi]|nr:hypothetical protein C8J57DRAFT_1477592 [Mycena rebaudengoi]
MLSLSMLSLSSKGLFGVFGGFVAAAQITVVVFSGLNFKVGSQFVARKDGFHRATRTSAVLLQPTRCALSNGTLESPALFFLGFFIIMLVSLVCAFAAKAGVTPTKTAFPPAYIPPGDNKQITFPNPPATFPVSDSQSPPPPPIDPGSKISTSSPRKRSRLWLLMILAILLLLAITIGGFCTHQNGVSSFISWLATNAGAGQAVTLWVHIPWIDLANTGLVIFSALSTCAIVIVASNRLASIMARLRRYAPRPNLEDDIRFLIHAYASDPNLEGGLVCLFFSALFILWAGWEIAHLFHIWGTVYIGRLFTATVALFIFGPPSVLAGILLLHAISWVAHSLIVLVAQGRSTRAGIITWLLLASILLFDKSGLLAFTTRIVFGGIERAEPIWDPLNLGRKILIVAPAVAYYIQFYLIIYPTLSSLPPFDSVRESVSGLKDDGLDSQ